MNVLELKLSSFRGYARESLAFQPETVHILQGKNAQGKTNLVEALYFLSHLRSFRTTQIRDMVRYGSHEFALEARIEHGDRTETLRAVFEDGHKYLFRFNDPVRSFSAFIGILNAVLFCPDDLFLFGAAPAVRRKFMDAEISKLSHTYTASLSQFQKLLKERNTVLKQMPADRTLVQAITQQMISLQIPLIRQRHAFIQKLSEKAGTLYPFFSDHQETLQVEYETFADPAGDLEAGLPAIFQEDLERDLRWGNTAHGIHKDDLIFLLDGKPVAATASQGQKRSILLALKLALCDLIKEQSGEYPVLLLDDVFSELDPGRRQKLIDLLPEKMQIFITTAEPVEADWTGHQVRKLTVENGKLFTEEDVE